MASRLNSKIKPRDVSVTDLVKDLSDGVSKGACAVGLVALSRDFVSDKPMLGHPHTSARNPWQRIPRSLCREAEAACAAF